MALSPDLLEILRCPDDRTPLKLAEPDMLEKLNAAIEAGSIKNKEGKAVSEKVDAGLLREDGKIVYPVRDDIPVLLIDEGLPVDPSA